MWCDRSPQGFTFRPIWMHHQPSDGNAKSLLLMNHSKKNWTHFWRRKSFINVIQQTTPPCGQYWSHQKGTWLMTASWKKPLYSLAGQWFALTKNLPRFKMLNSTVLLFIWHLDHWSGSKWPTQTSFLIQQLRVHMALMSIWIYKHP